MNNLLHRHIVIVVVIVAHGLALIGMKVDAKHLPWLASHLDPQLPHFIPTLSPRQPGRTQQWGECNISNHNPQGLEMAQRITICCHGPGLPYNRENP
jgi:hypothetical protein